MGTPISKSAVATQSLVDFCLYGTLPDTKTLRLLGIDVKMLEQSYEAVKEKLPQLDGYVALEDACRGRYAREHVQNYWDVLVAGAGLTGTRVLRFTTDEDNYPHPRRPLFGHHGFGDIEVFLARNGDWIIWDGGAHPGRPATFVRRRSVRTMLNSLDPLLDPRYAGKPNRAFVLRENLHRFLDAGISAKETRLAPLIVVRDDLYAVNGRFIDR